MCVLIFLLKILVLFWLPQPKARERPMDLTHNRPLKQGKFIFQTFQTSQISNFYVPNLEMDKHLVVAVYPFRNFGKFGKHLLSAVAAPLGSSPAVFGAPTRDARTIGQLKLCRMRLPQRQRQ